jgi:hypothetical protein
VVADWWWQTQWSGIGGKSERDILRVLLEFGKRHGQLIPVGVRVSLSWRDLAVAAGVGFGTVCRAVKRLKEKGWLRSDNAERGVEDSGAMVLLARPGGYTQGTAEKKSGAESVSTTARPRDRKADLPELTPCFRHGGFVGKTRAGVLYLLEVYGPQTDEALAERLGYSRARDVRRKLLHGYKKRNKDGEQVYEAGLVELGLVVNEGGVYRRGANYDKRVDEILDSKYGGGSKKIKEKDPGGSGLTVTYIVYIPARSERERAEADRRAYDDQRQRRRDRMLRYERRLTSDLERMVGVAA